MSISENEFTADSPTERTPAAGREAVSSSGGTVSGSQSFSKSDRLLLPREYRRVYERGQQLHSSLFAIFAMRTSQPRIRIGITASRKVGRAVKRNRCRRLVREVFRRHKTEFPTGWDLVVNAKLPLTKATYAAVESEFLRLTRRLWKS